MENFNQYFDFPLRAQQEKVFGALCSFIDDPESKVFILKGYAGTGKTTITGGFVKYLHQLKTYSKTENPDDLLNEEENNEVKPDTKPDIPKFSILASTGRAAKILSDKTIIKARTVHSIVYRMVSLTDDVENYIENNKPKQNLSGKYQQLSLFFEPLVINPKNCNLYIVDEASMISNKTSGNTSNARFGGGDLLGDLFRYDPKGKFIFVGDPAQLPPITQQESPALDLKTLQNYFPGQKIIEYTLTEIIRHKSENDILACATILRNTAEAYKQKGQQNNGSGKIYTFRQAQSSPANLSFNPLPLKGYKSIQVIHSEILLLEKYIGTIQTNGFEHATLITHSNKDCNILANYVRQQIYGNTGLLVPGDLLLVTQNNYVVDLVNGDLVTVKSVGEKVTRADLTFVNVEVEEMAGKKTFKLLLIVELLANGQVNLDDNQHRNLIVDFVLRMKKRGIEIYAGKNRKILNPIFKRMMMKDAYLNALRTTYGYCLTCHKSQGGEWNEVFLHLGKSLYSLRGSALYQWAYTAVTRTRNKLYINDSNWLIR
jgi:ATP-dependent exoDNAse (exonuclease V) alpha subunit